MRVRLFVSALVVTTLSAAPVVAVACETFCVGQGAGSHGAGHSSEHPSGPPSDHGTAHASHVHGADVHGTAAILTSGAHDCTSHDRIATPPSTLGRATPSVDSPPVVFVEPGSAAREMATAMVPVATAHDPPGTTGTTTVSVLRL